MPTLRIARTQPDGTGLTRICCEAPLDGHATAGQFVAVHEGELQPAYFALANEPGEPAELLVKAQGGVSDVLAAAAPGASFSCTDPLGRGFLLDPDDTNPLVILAVGSGMSAVRPIIEAEVREGLPRPVHLLYGVFTEAHAAYAERFETWRRAGVNVHLVLSDPPAGWQGATGFVQDAAVELGLVRADVTVLAVGFPEMIASIRTLYADAGAPADAVKVNF